MTPGGTFKIKQIGIALAAYRPPAFFVEQLESIRSQTWRNWVCVISCDSPVADLRSDPKLAPLLEDSRFVLQENPKRLGHKKNFEGAIRKAVELGADAIACSDQDDVWYPEKLERSVAALEIAGPLALVHCDLHVMVAGKVLPDTAWKTERRGVAFVAPEHLLIRNVVAGCAMLFDSELARRYPTIPEEAEYHDHWYALVAAFYGGVHALSQPLMAYRQHGANTVGVTPFAGRFALPRNVRISEITEKCRKGWLKSHTLAEAAQRAGLPLSDRLRGMFLIPGDHGFGILKMGLGHYWSDPPLARACIARATGKAFLLLSQRRTTREP